MPIAGVARDGSLARRLPVFVSLAKKGESKRGPSRAFRAHHLRQRAKWKSAVENVGRRTSGTSDSEEDIRLESEAFDLD